MSELIVIAYEDQHKAEEVRQKLLGLQREYLLDLEDAVVATKNQDGKIRLSQMFDTTLYGFAQGTFWGLLIGAIFLTPFFGAALGAASGAINGALTDVGIDDQFMKDVSQSLTPGSSALFVLVRKATPDKVLEEIKGLGGKVIRTSLTHDQQEKLQAALDGAKKEMAAAT